MIKSLKIFIISIVSILLTLYFVFLICPYFIKLDSFKEQVQQLTKEYSKLEIDYSNLKPYTTPFLSIGVIVEDLSIKLPDSSELLKTPKIKAGIALPSLLTLTVKTAKCQIDSLNINLDIINDEQYKIVRIIEDIINENNAKPKPQPKEPTWQDNLITWIVSKTRIKVPSVKLVDYKLNVNDLKTNHKLSLKGEELNIFYSSARNVVGLSTNATLMSDEKENIKANLKIKTAIPKITQTAKEEVDPDEKISIPFVNLVKIYQTYDLMANIDSDLRIRHSERRGFSLFGYLNIDDISLKLSDIRLPYSYLHAKFFRKNVEYDTNIFAKDNEKLSLVGMLNYGRKPKLQTNIQTEKIHFESLLDLFEGLLDSLNIKNNLSSIKATGYLSADANIKTNFKKIASSGSIFVKEGSFINLKNGVGIKDIVANLCLDNNQLNIKETHAIINNSQVNLSGVIDNKSNTDIKVDINKLSIADLYTVFAPNELKKLYDLKSLYLTMQGNLVGTLDNLNLNIQTQLDKLSLNDTKKTMFINNENASIDFLVNKNQIKGEIKNNGFVFNMPQMKTNLRANFLELDIDSTQIAIKPFDVLYNNASKANIKGSIYNYLKDPQINIFVDGKLASSDVNQTLGKEIVSLISSKGNIPFKVEIDGDAKKQNVVAQIYADSNNHITPVDIKTLVGLPSIINMDVKLQGNKIKIKDSGLYRKAQAGFSDDVENNMLSAEQLIDFSSVIEGNHINLLRINIPNELTSSISVFKKSSFKTKGKVILRGYFDKLTYGGDLKIKELSIPELLVKLNSLDLSFFTQGVDVALKNLDLNTSLINGSLRANLSNLSLIDVSNVNVESKNIDVDKSLKVLDELIKYMPPATSNNQVAVKTKTSSPQIPVVMKGKIDIAKLKTGAMEIKDIISDISLKNDILYLNNLKANAFEGKVNGDINMNLISGLIKVKMSGKNIDSDMMLKQAANMPGMISGMLKFGADIQLAGATYEEQVETLKGDVDFEILDGQYGPFAKLENFFLAENIRENPVFANTIGLILSPITTIDSTHFEKLTGELSFKDGIVNLKSIKSQGDILCILIQGNMDLLKNFADMKVRTRLASAVSDMLGPLAVANPINLIKKTPGLNIATANLFSVFSYPVTQEEYNQIPDFSEQHSDVNATKFQILLNGDVAKPLKLVKSFKWLALKEDIDKANEFSSVYIKEQEQLAKQELINKLQKEYENNNKIKVGVEKVLGMDTTAPAVKDILIEDIVKNKVESAKTQVNQKIEEKIEKATIDTQKKIDEGKAKLEGKLQNILESALIKTNEQKQ